MNLQGEYEFVTGLISDLKYEVYPNKSAYGFILKKNDWEEICKNHVISYKIFFNKCIERKKNI